MNCINLMGRLTRDPETKTLQSGSSLASFTIAVDRGDQNKNTDFIDCKAFGSKADFIGKYFAKGKPIALTGKLTVRSWTKEDGTKGKTAEVIVDSVYFVPRSSEANNAPESTGEELIF